jgi:triacylglycerol esterase/lipase EstA (alpha/beta hydrolase family)
VKPLRLVPLAAVMLLAACSDDASVSGSAFESDESSTGIGSADSGAEAAEAGADTDGDSDPDSDPDSDDDTPGNESPETSEPDCDPARTTPVLAEQEFLAAGEAAQNLTLGACEDHVWWVSAASGVETTITIDASAAVEVAISYPDAPSFTNSLTTATLYSPGKLEFVAPRSGEFAVLIRPQNPAFDPELELDYGIEVACTNSCQRETTRFPIVLVHGWTGFENIGPIGYFYKVREDLESLRYPVEIAILDPYNSVEIRGEQLSDFVTTTLQVQRARKVNLIGHSQGGIDSRYVASDAGGGQGGEIGAIITVGTPHYGTPITDVALGLLPGSSLDVLAFFLNFLGSAQDQHSDAEASLYTLSETHMQGEFNVLYTDDPRVKYMSWSGDTCIGGFGCGDAVDLLLMYSYQVLSDIAGPNDGLVPESSAVWGEYLGSIAADHIDEIGQIAGFTSINYDHVEFYRQNARLLRDQRF